MAKASSKKRSAASPKAQAGAKTVTKAAPPKPNKKPAPSALPSAPPPPASVPEPAPAALWNDDDPRFWQMALALLLLGIALRLGALARAPYSSDEAIHAWFAQGFQNYNYDPIYHGPLLYHLLAFAFALISPTAAGDFVGRMVPALLGIGTLALIIGPARRRLGHKGALWCLALVAISPVMVAYHRVLIHDALVMILTLGAILCFQRSLETHSWTITGRQARVGLMALLTLFVATKANAFFIIAMLGVFWGAIMLRRRMIPADLPPGLTTWLPITLFFIIAVASHLSLREPELKTYVDWLQSHHYTESGISALRAVHSEKLFKIISLGSVGALLWWLILAPRVAQVEAPPEEELAERPRFDIGTPAVAGWVAVFLFFYLFGHGAQWWRIPFEFKNNRQAWTLRFDNSVRAIKQETVQGLRASPQMIAATLRLGKLPPKDNWTAEQLTDAPDWDTATMAIPRMLAYWGGQQATPRLPGPHDYYLVLMILYELPIALAAIGGIIHASRRRTPFGDLLLWWAFTSFVLYAMANEKVPWLLTHIMLPLILLTGIWLGDVAWRGVKRQVLIGSCVVGAIFLLRNVLATSFGRPNDQHEPLYYAQTTEAFHDKWVEGLSNTASDTNNVWVDTENQWPMVWYMRDGAPWVGRSHMALNSALPNEPLRMAVASVAAWDKYKSSPALKGWKAQKVDFFIWPRASWPAVRPHTFWDFWAHRLVNPKYKDKDYRTWQEDGTLNDDSMLAFPGEWSNSEVVVATP